MSKIIVEEEVEEKLVGIKWISIQVTDELFSLINSRAHEKQMNRSIYIRSLIQRDIRDAESENS